MNKKLDAVLTGLLFVLYTGFVVFVWAVVLVLLTGDDPHCIQYDSTTGDCVKEMTVEELIDNAQE